MKKLIVMAAACLMTLAAAAQTKIVAHRGYWDCAGSAQNSITSLKLADKIGCYGSEFDVHLTKDGVIVVHHDQNVGKIDIQTSTYKALKKERLKNGEKIPTLEQYLDAGKDLSCKLVLEIKRQMVQSHEDSLVRQCVDMVKSKGLTDRIVWISFSGKACELLHQLLPDAPYTVSLGRLGSQDHKGKGALRHRLRAEGVGLAPGMDQGVPRPRTGGQRVDGERSQHHQPVYQGRCRLHHNKRARGGIETCQIGSLI